MKIIYYKSNCALEKVFDGEEDCGKIGNRISSLYNGKIEVS